MANGPSLLIVEASATLVGLSIAAAWPSAGAIWFTKGERFFSRLAHRKSRSVLTVTAAALLLRLAILPLSPIPQPFVHDEFANLLAADTFASGRLTNATHPLWISFESFHITQKPTYMSMYFPAQGLVMAAGEVLTGNPWFGIWLSASLMCGAICWMLQGWLPPGWALFGGMLAVMRLGLFSYWIDDYHGGAVPAIGGALVLGALPRMLRKTPQTFRIRDGVWMAVGVGLLANSRPYEGMLVCIPVAAFLGWRFMSAPAPFWSVALRRLTAPVAVLVVVASVMAWYNYRVFGSALTFPYQINRATYASAPVFVWQQPRPEPFYRYKVMRDFYSGWEMRDFRYARTRAGFLYDTAQKTGTIIIFFFGLALLPPLIMLSRVLRDRRLRPLLVTAVVFVLGLGMNVWLFPHYLAPFACGIYAILLQSMRHLRVRNLQGRAIVRTIPLLCLTLCGLRLFSAPLNLSVPRWPTMWYGVEPLGLPRARVLRELESQPGPQLAVVRYTRDHPPFDDWVYNAADIDKSKVVWAREAGDRDSRDLLKYFNGRSVWLVEPDFDPPKVSPYP